MSTIIIGAGLAGLAAAQRLAVSGRAVTILEARARIGGRVHTVRDAELSRPIELGAEWYEEKGPVSALFRGAGWMTSDDTGERVLSSAEGWENLDDRPEENASLLNSVRLAQGDDLSLAAALDECCNDARFAKARAMLTGYVEGFHAARADRVSVRWLREVEAKHPASNSGSRSPTGLQGVIDALRSHSDSRTKLHLDTVAREVHWRRREVEIHTSSDALFRADSVIIAVPLPILKGSVDNPAALSFSPRIAAKEEAAGLVDMGDATKMVLAFASPFWRDIKAVRGVSFFHAFDQPFPTWWTSQSQNAPLLTAWAGGPQSSRLGATSGAALLDLAIESLANALHTSRREVEGNLRAHYHHDWNGDPFSRGAYTYVAVGGSDAHQELARPVDDTLFFAGEATCGGGQNATMEGAIKSGWRAADEVLALSARAAV